MGELGVQLIFALSPQAKGRVERTAGTFQDRLITELRLAGATTMEEAKAVLKQFLPRFNRRFGVPPRWPEPAFRPSQPELSLSQVLCFKHRMRVARDNTVKFHKHTLQLLPSQQRRSYAGAVVVVLQGLDGRLSLQHEGRIIASQDAPPSPGALRSGDCHSPVDAVGSPGPEDRNAPREMAPKPLNAEIAAAMSYDSVIDNGEVAELTVTVVTSPTPPITPMTTPLGADPNPAPAPPVA